MGNEAIRPMAYAKAAQETGTKITTFKDGEKTAVYRPSEEAQRNTSKQDTAGISLSIANSNTPVQQLVTFTSGHQPSQSETPTQAPSTISISFDSGSSAETSHACGSNCEPSSSSGILTIFQAA